MNKTEHLLTCLMEECAEIQKAAAKALRFGLGDHHPDEPAVSNSESIAHECADLCAIIEMLEEMGIIPQLSKPALIQQKKDKVTKYINYAEEQGTIVDEGMCDAARYAVLARDYFRKPQASQTIKYTCRKAEQPDFDTVAALLCELHTHYVDKDDFMEQNKTLFTDNRQVFFLAYDNSKPFAAAHGSLRSEYVNGKEYDETSGYLEGIYVQPEYRMNGVAAALVRLCEQWAKEQGCREFLSDCMIDNTESYRFHLRIGFTETERCIFFRKDMGDA